MQVEVINIIREGTTVNLNNRIWLNCEILSGNIPENEITVKLLQAGAGLAIGYELTVPPAAVRTG